MFLLHHTFPSFFPLSRAVKRGVSLMLAVLFALAPSLQTAADAPALPEIPETFPEAASSLTVAPAPTLMTVPTPEPENPIIVAPGNPLREHSNAMPTPEPTAAPSPDPTPTPAPTPTPEATPRPSYVGGNTPHYFGEALLRFQGERFEKPDVTPPEIKGAVDKTVFLGRSISYKTGVMAIDDRDGEISFQVDNKAVNPNEAGDYPVIYSAQDRYGNSVEVTVTLHIVDMASTSEDEQQVYATAEQILAQITSPDMDSMEVAYAIYRWVRSNIRYTGSSDKSDWVQGARQAFDKRRGDCFNCFAAAKALLTVAGIENCDVIRYPIYHARHYWNMINLGSGWYHFDANPFNNINEDFFMLTDDELEAWDKRHYRAHGFDHEIYPVRATESVQHLVDYSK